MMQNRFVLPLVLLLAALSWSCVAKAQNPTAVQKMQLSAFGGVSPVFTGLSGGKNFSLTGGVDLALSPFRGLRPTLEVRGTYPTDRGLVVSEKSVLGGLRVDFLLGRRLHPYGDFLFGRGGMNYGLGYIYGNYDYELTTTYVYSPGAGVDYDLGEHLTFKADGQYQRWASAPTATGTVYSTVATVGVVYRFNFNSRGIR